MRDKKGIMTKFVLTMLLALIISGQACVMVSKIVRLSGQAKDDFGKFVGEIKDFAGSDKERENFMLIMDEETAIVGFNQGHRVVESCRVQGATGKESCWEWTKPEVEECKEGSCVCLFRTIVRVEEKLEADRTVEYKSSICKNMGEVVFDMPHFRTEVEGEKYYHSIKGGFGLGRGIQTVYLMKGAVFKNRRNTIYSMKKEGEIFVCWEKSCETVEVKIKGPEYAEYYEELKYLP